MKLLPFGSVTTCPACSRDVKGFRVKWSEYRVVPGGDGRFVNISTISDPPIPHLEKNCPHCGYGWLEEPAIAEQVQR